MGGQMKNDVQKTFGLVIGGKSVRTKSSMAVKNPSTGATVGKMPLASRKQAETAVEIARAAFATWRSVADEKRADACIAIAAKIEQHVEELATLLTLEQGKPLGGLGSRFEMGGTMAWTRHTASLKLPFEVLQDSPEGRVELHRKPIGVVLSITPWNWPVMIACWHIIPAIRAGNTVVIKPSPNTPLSTIRLVELMDEVLPPGVVNCVTCDNDVAAALTTHPDISKITFTGSTATGRKIM
jgi:acyl-CoA reductase-like NAD-dependent aldehyde dehydrogenase